MIEQPPYDWWREKIRTLRRAEDLKPDFSVDFGKPNPDIGRFIRNSTDLQARREWRSQELRAKRYLHQTGLRPDQCTMARFRGKAYPQWIGSFTRLDPGRLPL